LSLSRNRECSISSRITGGSHWNVLSVSQLPTTRELSRGGSNRNAERARLTRNEAAGYTMPTARELKMEIPARDPALPDFETAPPDGDFDGRPFCFRAKFEEETCTDTFRYG